MRMIWLLAKRRNLRIILISYTSYTEDVQDNLVHMAVVDNPDSRLVVLVELME